MLMHTPVWEPADKSYFTTTR